MTATTIEDRLARLGIKQAPLQLTDHGNPDKRYVTLRDPPGVYYLSERSNPADPFPKGFIQLLFVAMPDNSDHFAELLGMKLLDKHLLPGSTDKVPVHTAVLEPF